MKIFAFCCLIISMISIFIFVFLVVEQLVWVLKKRKLSNESLLAVSDKKLEKSSDIKTSGFAWMMRNGIGFLNKPCKLILKKIPLLQNVFNNFKELLLDYKIHAQTYTIASSLLMISFVIGVIVGFLFKSVIAAIAVVLCLFVVLILFVKAQSDKKIEEIREAIPDSLKLMSTCFASGYSLYQTFGQLAKETKNGLNKLYKRCTHILQTGGTISESLEPIKDSKSTPELAFVAVALDVQHHTGGSMKPVIESAREMIESKLELLRLLHVQTAQAKLSSRIVIVMPFALIAIFSIISPNFLQPFFSSLIGVVLFVIACLMQAAGIILVRKTLQVEV